MLKRKLDVFQIDDSIGQTSREKIDLNSLKKMKTMSNNLKKEEKKSKLIFFCFFNA